jgi:hypothetical protein
MQNRLEVMRAAVRIRQLLHHAKYALFYTATSQPGNTNARTGQYECSLDL